jgi:hypothetical protein
MHPGTNSLLTEFSPVIVSQNVAEHITILVENPNPSFESVTVIGAGYLKNKNAYKAYLVMYVQAPRLEHVHIAWLAVIH